MDSHSISYLGDCLLEFATGLRMDAHNAVQRIGTILIIVAGVCGSAICVGSVHIYTGDFDLPIIDEPGPGNEITKAIIQIEEHFSIHDLDVRINITHTNVFDLQLFLQSPAGTRICLNMYDFEKEFSVYPNYTNTIFDDEALFSIKEGEVPFTGRFRPIEPYKLSKFDGEDTYGPWNLQIYDMWDWDTGTLNNFELTINAPEPATAMLFTLATAMFGLFNPRRSH